MHGCAPVYWSCKLALVDIPIDQNESGVELNKISWLI